MRTWTCTPSVSCALRSCSRRCEQKQEMARAVTGHVLRWLERIFGRHRRKIVLRVEHGERVSEPFRWPGGPGMLRTRGHFGEAPARIELQGRDHAGSWMVIATVQAGALHCAFDAPPGEFRLVAVGNVAAARAVVSNARHRPPIRL